MIEISSNESSPEPIPKASPKAEITKSNSKAEEPNRRRSTRTKTIIKIEEHASPCASQTNLQLSSVDEKLLRMIKKTHKRSTDKFLVHKWLPFIPLTKIDPKTIYRLTDNWSFLSSKSIMKSVTFMPTVREQRILKNKSSYRRECFVTWSQFSTATEEDCPIFDPLPSPHQRLCLESLRNPDRGSWVDVDKVPTEKVTVNVRSLPYNYKLLPDELIRERQEKK